MKCPKCSERFSARTALCEDWKNPERSFGCPHCGTFFVRKEENKRKSLINTVLFVGVGLQAFNIFVRHLKDGGDFLTMIYSLVILISLLLIFVLSTWPLFRELKESPTNQHDYRNSP